MQTYRMTPIEGTPKTYRMSPLKDNKIIYRMTPLHWEENVPEGDSTYEAEGWKMIATIHASALDASPSLIAIPGVYFGYIDHVQAQGYQTVLAVGVSGAWNDGGGPPEWNSSVYIATKIATGMLGKNGLYSHDEAEEALIGSTVTLGLGNDGLIYWGIYDNYVADNSGGITFRLYAR